MTTTLDLRDAAVAMTALCGSEHLRLAGGAIHVAPAHTEQVAAVLRFASLNGLAVSARGAGTKQDWGNPSPSPIVLETHRLNAVLDHPWQDMTATVQAGCTWAAMQTALAVHGQFVALDPLWPSRATVGGIAGVNDSGRLRLKYGSLRDLILGMTIVLADGTIARTGGKVVKNVAGYDLHKLMTGAFGTLGIVTEVTFRLHSIPRHTETHTIASAHAEPLGRLLLRVRDSHLCAEAMQLRSTPAGFHLDIELASLPDVLKDQATALAALAAEQQLSISPPQPSVWSARESLFESLPDSLPDSLSNQTSAFVLKATMLPTAIAQFSTAVRALGGTSVTQAVGIMTAALPADAAAQLPALRQQFEAAHGSLTLLRQPPNSALDPWGHPPDSLPLMRQIKQRFDPNRILNPGRFLGGI